MDDPPAGRVELRQGTLDMLILRTLRFGSAHGHEIAKHIQRTSDEVLQVERGSLYPALHGLERRGWIAGRPGGSLYSALQRLERKGWVTAKWELAAKDSKRELKHYRPTAAGRRQLLAEQSRWKQMAAVIARVMWPVGES